MKRTEILFYFAWILFSFSVLMELTAISSDNEIVLIVTKLIRYGAYAVCCIKILLDYVKKNNIYVIIIMMVVLVISGFKSTNKTMLLYSLILLAAYNLESSKIMKISLWMQGFFLTFVVGLSQLGILEDYLFVRDETHYRHGLGFGWTTTAPILFLYFMLIFIYLKKDKFNIFHAAVLELINIWFYLMTDSRMAFLISSVFIVFFAIQSINKRRWKCLSKFNKIYIAMPVLICVFSLLLFKFYDADEPFWIRLNSVLSDRLALGVDAIRNFGFTLFGQNIEWVGFSIKTPTKMEAVGYNYVDSSYLQLILNYGVFFLIVVITIYVVAIYKAIKSRDYYLTVILIIILGFSVTEPRLMNLAFNPFPLLAFCQLKGENSYGKI